MSLENTFNKNLIQEDNQSKFNLINEIRQGFEDLTDQGKKQAPKELKLKVFILCTEFNVSQKYIAKVIGRTESVISRWISQNQKSSLGYKKIQQPYLDFIENQDSQKLEIKISEQENENQLEFNLNDEGGVEQNQDYSAVNIDEDLNSSQEDENQELEFDKNLNSREEDENQEVGFQKQDKKFDFKKWIFDFFQKLPRRFLKLIFVLFVGFVFGVVCYLNSEFNQSQGDHKYLAFILSFSCEAILFSIGLIQVTEKYIKNRFIIQLLIAISIIGNISIQITNRIILDFISTAPTFLKEQKQNLEEKITLKEELIKNKSDSIIFEYKEVRRLQNIKYSKKASEKLILIKKDEDKINRLLIEKTALEGKLRTIQTTTRFSKLAPHIFLLIQRIALVLALWFLSRILSEMFRPKDGTYVVISR